MVLQLRTILFLFVLLFGPALGLAVPYLGDRTAEDGGSFRIEATDFGALSGEMSDPNAGKLLSAPADYVEDIRSRDQNDGDWGVDVRTTTSKISDTFQNVAEKAQLDTSAEDTKDDFFNMGNLGFNSINDGAKRFENQVQDSFRGFADNAKQITQIQPDVANQFDRQAPSLSKILPDGNFPQIPQSSSSSDARFDSSTQPDFSQLNKNFNLNTPNAQQLSSSNTEPATHVSPPISGTLPLDSGKTFDEVIGLPSMDKFFKNINQKVETAIRVFAKVFLEYETTTTPVQPNGRDLEKVENDYKLQRRLITSTSAKPESLALPSGYPPPPGSTHFKLSDVVALDINSGLLSEVVLSDPEQQQD